MTGKSKSSLAWLLSAVMTLGLAFTAQAADAKIDKVTLQVSYDEPKSGDDIGSVTVSTDSDEFQVENADYTNDSDVWSVGDLPEILVELSAMDGYRFAYTTKSHFKVSGGSAEFKKAHLTDDSSMEVYLNLKRIGGKLTGADGLDWNGSTAYWDPVDGAKSYEVKLLRDDKTVTTVETTGTAYDFGGYINREGSYTFRVRAISDYNNRAGQWSEDSSSLDIDQEEAWMSGNGQWKQDQTGWWYAYNGGGYPADCWKLIDQTWYYFNRSGYMMTGWQRIDGTWYYLAPSGAMTTGWQLVNGVWYYMNSSGQMQTGWQYIGGKWYYLGSDGAMYADRQTPDGHYVDGSGARTD